MWVPTLNATYWYSPLRVVIKQVRMQEPDIARHLHALILVAAGALYDIGNGITIYGTATFDNNTAEERGGATYVRRGTVQQWAPL